MLSVKTRVLRPKRNLFKKNSILHFRHRYLKDDTSCIDANQRNEVDLWLLDYWNKEALYCQTGISISHVLISLIGHEHSALPIFESLLMAALLDIQVKWLLVLFCIYADLIQVNRVKSSQIHEFKLSVHNSSICMKLVQHTDLTLFHKEISTFGGKWMTVGEKIGEHMK